MSKFVYDEKEEICSPHYDKVKKVTPKSNHKHIYDYCVLDCNEKKLNYKTGTYSFEHSEYVGTYCTICGKLKDIYCFSFIDKIPDDVNVSKLKHFDVKDIWQRYIEIS